MSACPRIFSSSRRSATWPPRRTPSSARCWTTGAHSWTTGVPRTAGRLEAVYVRMGDHVSPGQRIAKIEDQEIQEQVKQAEAAFQVARATIRQRDADLALAQTNVERSRSLFQRQLLPKQT